MTTDLSEFHGIFFEESFEALDAMEAGLVSLDIGAADPETVNTIFRGAHSIKGGSGMFGFTDVATLTHAAETLLDKVRSGSRPVTQVMVDVMLLAVDCLRAMLKALQTGEPVDREQAGTVKAQLEQELNHPGAGDEASAPVEAPPVVPAAGWRIHFKPFPDLLKTGNDPYRILRELGELGELATRCDVSAVPPFANLDPEQCHLAWDMTLRGAVERAQVVEVFDWVEGDCELVIEPLVATAADAPAADPAVAALPAATLALAPEVEDRRAGEDRRKADRRGATKTEDAGSIRVSIDKLDVVINLVGELVITQSMLSRFGSDFDLSQVDRLRDGLNQLSRNSRELQESVMQIRMLPISFSFNRFPRLVRDLGHKMGKKVELVLSGEQTELDKTVLEKIGDPLVHLVRNSLDHGIEAPAARLAAGKPETGRLHLHAYHAGGNIVIEVHDDGAGLPRAKILQKARERGLVGPEEILSDEDVANLIFRPGFSTAEVVTDVSGRGVGMDVVRRNVSALGGTVDVRSEEGKGSTFTIRLPLTLAILDGQLITVGAQTYVISLVSIVESLLVKRSMVNEIAGRSELCRLRGEYIPIVRLYKVFGIEGGVTDLEQGLVVVVEADGVRIGLFVDELLGQQQVVIKSLETNFRQVKGLSGATILGDGRVALIIDVQGVIALHNEQMQGARGAPSVAA